MVTQIQEPFSVGDVQIRNRVVLAPMSGVSDLPFRRLAWSFGAGLVVTEMIASRELVLDRGESKLRMAGDGINPHVVQLAGRDADWMAKAAKLARDAGADIIDINMGCPAKKVIGGYAGSALMRDPALALELISATVNSVDCPVTLKMRLGWDEASLNAVEIAMDAVAAGIQMITIHGRTRQQFYKGSADWHAIARVRDAVKVPFVANGDVETIADIDQILAITGADAVMLGRSTQGQPWCFGALTGGQNADRPLPISNRDVCDVVVEHYRMMIAHYGEGTGVRHARKHIGWYLERHAPATPPELKKEIMTSVIPNDVERLLSNALLNNGSTSSTTLTSGEAA